MARPNLPQFEKQYDVYKMRALVDDLQRWFLTVEGSVQEGANAIIGEHNDLGGRGEAGAHPISAIDGLQTALNSKASAATVAVLQQLVSDNADSINAVEIRVTDNETGIAVNDARITVLEAEAMAALAQRVDDTASATVYYFGEAQPGTAESAAAWRIQRITFTTPGEDDVDVEWADGVNAFTKIWDDRLAIAYS